MSVPEYYVEGAFDSAQQRVLETALYPSGTDWLAGLSYTALGLNGEAGEVAEQVKKALRDDGGVLTAERREKIKHELGDVFWYVCACAAEAGLTLSEVVEANAEKLARRKAAGTINGSGSER